MARTGSSSKFVPVNLNNSYGQTLPLSNGGASASSSLGRSRSFSSSYGGMVSLSRSTRVSSSSPSSASASASSRASKLAVPRPMNLPSLRREHSGNDPTIALVGSSGSSGWTKQTGDEALDVSTSRSDSHSTSWGNRASAQDASTQITDRKLALAGRQSAYSPPGPGDASTHSTPVEKAVVFRGEDFPTLQAVAVPYSPSLPPPPRSRDSLSKQQRDKRLEDQNELKQKEYVSGDEPRQSNYYFDQQFQPAQPVRMQGRGTFPEQNDSNADKGGAYPRGPSPLVKLTHTSNWADDERETLSSFQPQESAQSDWAEPNSGFRSMGNWQMDHSGDVDFRHPVSRTGYPIRSDADSSMRMESPSKNVYGKDGDLNRVPLSGGARFELDFRGGFDRMNNGVGRNDFLKRGWSFSAAESNLNRDGRFTNPNNVSERENYGNGKAFFREGNNIRHDTVGGDMLSRDVRPGFYYQDVGQRQESKFGKDVLLGRQGFPGGVSPGPRTGRGPGFTYNGSDLALPSKHKPEADYRRDKRASGFYGNVHDDDPFLGDGMGTRPTSLYVLQPRMKKNALKDHEYRDPARESFEAELERVEKMLEQERQRAVEERERAIELARKEQEEQERLAREEEEMRIKLEEEAREAAYREQKEAEDVARKVEEARKAREEEKRMAELEEERRKEAARKKLLELEDRMAKRESQRKREEVRQTEIGSMLRTVSADASMEHEDNGRRSTDTSRESHWKSGKMDEDDRERLSSMVPLPVNSSAIPSILRSPRLSPYPKEESGSSTEGARFLQTWKKEAVDSGHNSRSIQKGSQNTLHLQNDRPQQELDDRLRGSSYRNANVHKSSMSTDTHSRLNNNPDAADERNWWVRDSPNKPHDSVEAYPQNADTSEYPLFGRLRQSLPKQPRVLPPPPGPTSFRKQFSQRNDSHSGASTFDIERIEMAPASKEELSLTSNESTVSHEAGIKESPVTNIQVSEQFDSVPSEEVVLSDAGSQFSDDTVEEVVTQAYQEQELHSDAVSETYTEGEVDEISDLTEAQESSEDYESQKPNIWEACSGEVKADNEVESFGQAGNDNLEHLQEQHDKGNEGSIVLNTKDEEERTLNDSGNSGDNITSSYSVEDTARANADNSVSGTEEAEKPADAQSLIATGVNDGQELMRKTEDLASEKKGQDQEIPPFPYQTPFLPVGSGDATQIRHLESVSSRQSLVQQFQQPFSFMAVPLPQSSTLNHVGASVPMLTPVHGLSNQQDLPFHVQLGLLPGVPLMPNAIQIGSIQMPLHIHPQIPQLAHVHGQQAPLFQFGQIGPSLPMSQPLPMTHMAQPAMQMHHAIGQVSVSQQHLQADFASAVDTRNDSADLNRHAKFGDVAAEVAPLLPAVHNLAYKEDLEVKQGALADSEGSRIPAEREVQLPLEQPEIHSATVSVSKPDGQKTSTEDTFESSWDADRGLSDLKERPGSKPSRGGRRRTSAPRYQGILGRGRGRFHGAQNHFYPAPHLSSENWPEGGPKRFARGKMIRRNYRRAEYRVREPPSIFDRETAAAEFSAGPPSNVEDSKEVGGYRYVKKGPASHAKSVGEENGHSRTYSTQTTAKGDQPGSQNVVAPMSKTSNLLKKYEMDNAEDAPFRTGVVRVFEQPGIETPNDKDDFIKVRSKRQLLRELKEQREKESKVKGTDSGSRDQFSKKQQKSSAKTGINIRTAGANPIKNIVKRRPTRGAESVGSDGKLNTSTLINGATGISSAVGKRNLTSPKPGQILSASKVITSGLESIVSFAHDNHTTEQLTITAWGGQRSNQEVVSLTQIQLEEAMKPYRLDAPFSESACISEKALVSLESGLCSSSALAVDKPVITSGPLSSLLAGEKIQFGAVTSPTPIPPNSRSSTPLSAVRTGSPLGFGSDPSHIPGHTSSFVTNFLEPPLDATFSSKGDPANKDDGFEGKVVDLELEAEAEAAASAVVAAAISNEDSIEIHNNIRVSDINAGCSTLTSANPLTVQIQSNSASDNPMAVALPADLSVETPRSLFQGSPMSLPNLSGVMLQSIPNGAPAFPCLEMGPLLGGPVFNFGPREDVSMASMEPGLSGWQRRHVGTPDSFYGAPPFLSPAGISSIQGHPHMLVYANPYTPVGQFGQLGVSFMGTAYHPSGKQPDWTHIPLSSASSGALALNDGDLSAGSNGPIASQHLNGQRTAVAGSSVMSVGASPNLFDAGLAAPFQVPQMDGFVQSHWSKAPAPPVHSVPISGSSLHTQNFPLSRPAIDLNMQMHSSRVFLNQAGHSTHPVDASSTFHQLPIANPASSNSFSSADAGAQFPDELGLEDSMPTVNMSQSDAGGPLSEASHANSSVLVETTGIKMQRGRRPAHSSQGNLSSVNNNTSGDLISAANLQDQSRNGHVSLEFQSKNLGRIGTPSLRNNSLQFTEQRASKQALPRESTGGEWPRGNQRKGASGRISTSDRGGSVLPSKMKQIYVAKPAADARKLSAACS